MYEEQAKTPGAPWDTITLSPPSDTAMPVPTGQLQRQDGRFVATCTPDELTPSVKLALEKKQRDLQTRLERDPPIPQILFSTSDPLIPQILFSMTDPPIPQILFSTSDPPIPQILLSISDPPIPQILFSTSDPLIPQILFLMAEQPPSQRWHRWRHTPGAKTFRDFRLLSCLS